MLILGWSIDVAGTKDEVRKVVESAEVHDHGGMTSARAASEAAFAAVKMEVMKQLNTLHADRVHVMVQGPRSDLHPGMPPIIAVGAVTT